MQSIIKNINIKIKITQRLTQRPTQRNRSKKKLGHDKLNMIRKRNENLLANNDYTVGNGKEKEK